MKTLTALLMVIFAFSMAAEAEARIPTLTKHQAHLYAGRWISSRASHTAWFPYGVGHCVRRSRVRVDCRVWYLNWRGIHRYLCKPRIHFKNVDSNHYRWFQEGYRCRVVATVPD